jgi:hypothetical protein
VVLGAAAIWWAARGPRSAHDGADDEAEVAKLPDPMAYVRARAGRADVETVKELIGAYGKWSPREDALEARKAVIDGLLKHPDVRVGVEAVLTAVEADQTPRALDPMWPYLVQSLASVWDAVTFKFGRDLVQIESRAKPKDVLLSSLASMAETAGNKKLTDSQRTELASDLIDMYPTLKPEQKPEVDKALAALAGTDVVDILAGKGLAPGSTDLKAAAAQQRELQAAQAAYHVAPAPTH